MALLLLFLSISASSSAQRIAQPHQNARPDTECLGMCSASWHGELRGALGPSALERIRRLDVAEVVDMFANQTAFKAFCRAYTEFQTCSAECPASHIKQVLGKGLRMLDKYCLHSYKEILAYFPCLREAAAELQNEKTMCMGDCKGHYATVAHLYVAHWTVTTRWFRRDAESLQLILSVTSPSNQWKFWKR